MSIYSSTYTLVFFITVSAVLGAVMGSFLNCAAWRIVHKESFLKGRSKCPECGHTLGIPDLIPVFSFIFLRGKCRFCKKKISPRYLITELIMAALFAGCALRFDLTPILAVNLVFICCLFTLTLTDLDTYIIPNGTLIVAAAAWLIYLPFSGLGWADIGFRFLASAAFGGGILLLSLIMDKVLKKESLGGGDVKLFFVMGLYLGLVPSLFAVMLACVLGLLFVLISRRRKGEHFPFGPAISAATVVMLFCGDFLSNLYLSFFKA